MTATTAGTDVSSAVFPATELSVLHSHRSILSARQILLGLPALIATVATIWAPWQELWPGHPLVAAGMVLTSAGFVFTGTVLVADPRGRTTGLAVLAVAVLWPINHWAFTDLWIGPFASWMASGAAWALLTYVITSYPRDLGWTRSSIAFVGSAFVLLIPLNAVIAMLGTSAWAGFSPDAYWPTVWPGRSAFVVCTDALSAMDLALALTGCVVIWQRVRSASGLDRLALRPAAIGIGLSAWVGAGAAAFGNVAFTESSLRDGLFLQGVGLLALPFSLVSTALRLRLTRLGVTRLIQQLATRTDLDGMAASLRHTLQDDALELRGSDRLGAAPAPGRDNVLVPDSEGDVLAAIDVDARLRHYPDLLADVVAAVSLALENARLHADLQHELNRVTQSRMRIIDAQLQERRRLERDLHDGAQQHLLALALTLDTVRRTTKDDVTAAELTGIRSALQTALEEIRQLSQGIHPALLSEGGLQLALDPVLDRMPSTVHLDLSDERPGAATETAAYFVIVEALANIVKHAGAQHVRISARRDGDELRIVIADDGVGGADPARGTGLSGMAERVQGLGGSFSVESPDGGGTFLRASLPWRIGAR